MSDGREEREELKKRREQEKRENREDRIDRGDVDEWEPERVDSGAAVAKMLQREGGEGSRACSR